MDSIGFLRAAQVDQGKVETAQATMVGILHKMKPFSRNFLPADSAECQAMTTLIKDKCIVVTNRTDYEKKALDLLSDNKSSSFIFPSKAGAGS